jgi:hypothetical protein
MMQDSVKIKTLTRDASHFIRKCMIMFGANKSGKTTVLLDILKQIRPYIPNIIAYAPTADSNGSWKGVVPNKLIKRVMTLGSIKEVYDRQKDAAAAYNIANDPEILRSLFQRVAKHSQMAVEDKINQLQNKMDHKLSSSNISKGERMRQSKKIIEMSNNFKVSLYKQVIRKMTPVLAKMKLAHTEIQALKFIDFNPHMCIVFDDCASEFTKKFQGHPIIKELFFNYRHSYITMIFTFQDDTGLESFLRKNASLSFFTTQECANAYFGRKSNSFSKSTQNDAFQKIEAIFDERNKGTDMEFWKMIYVRDDATPLRYYLAQEHEPFKFGSKALWKYCEKIESIQKANHAIESTFGRY